VPIIEKMPFTDAPKLMQLLISILFVTLAATGDRVLAAAETATETASDILALSGGEKERDLARQRLLAKPRAEVRVTLKNQLQVVSSQVFALRALAELGDDFRTPEIEAAIEGLIKKSNSFEVFDALNPSLNKNKRPTAKLYLERLKAIAKKRKNSPLKSSLLNGLARMQEPLSDPLFSQLTADEDYTVRESAVRHFVATREKVSQSAQATRFRNSLKLQPFQTRLVAMEAFADLPLPELKALSQAFDRAQCKTEKFDETRIACEKILESLQKAGAS
jgi:hypothetical protein